MTKKSKAIKLGKQAYVLIRFEFLQLMEVVSDPLNQSSRLFA